MNETEKATKKIVGGKVQDAKEPARRADRHVEEH
jgi:hypothetical protein